MWGFYGKYLKNYGQNLVRTNMDTKYAITSYYKNTQADAYEVDAWICSIWSLWCE